jgi:hypothetical protein
MFRGGNITEEWFEGKLAHYGLMMADVAPKFVFTSDKAILESDGMYPAQFLGELCVTAKQIEETRVEAVRALANHNRETRAARLAAMKAKYT